MSISRSPIKRAFLAIAIAGALSGCAGLAIPASLATGGILGYLKAADEAAPIILRGILPVTQAWCGDRLKEGHTVAGLEVLHAYCDHLPTDAATLAEQATYVVLALATVDGPL